MFTNISEGTWITATKHAPGSFRTMTFFIHYYGEGKVEIRWQTQMGPRVAAYTCEALKAADADDVSMSKAYNMVKAELRAWIARTDVEEVYWARMFA